MAPNQLKEANPLDNARHQTDASHTDHTGNVQQRTLVLTEEERLVMKECDRDSFYKRALPLSLGSMLGALMMVRSGRWNPHPRLGPLPKVLIFGGVGYFVGKIAYLPVCQQKILNKIPNSNLAAAVRKSKGLPEPETSTATWDESISHSTRIKDNYSAPEGLDERFRPTLDRDVKEHEASQEKGSISYEELRRRNRQEYGSQASKLPPKASDNSSYDSPLMLQKPRLDEKPQEVSLESPVPPPSGVPSKKKRTNIWGDPVEE